VSVVSKRRLPLLISALRESLNEVKAEQEGYKASAGPKGQTCESCEFGEMFDDDDGPKGWCRRWDRDVTRGAWCESWVRSSRLDHPEVKTNDSPERAKETDAKDKVAAAAGKKTQSGKKFAGVKGGFKKKANKFEPKAALKPTIHAAAKKTEPGPRDKTEPETQA